MATNCDDCGRQAKRRQRCRFCIIPSGPMLVCSDCYQHNHYHEVAARQRENGTDMSRYSGRPL
jgi:hypothetical protein